MKATNARTVLVTVELFGHARLVCGRKEIAIQLPTELTSSDLAQALYASTPSLKGVVVDELGHDLMASYTANLNGHSFLEDSLVRVTDGDRILVFSSQAGG